MISDQRRLSIENNEDIQAELNSDDSEKENRTPEETRPYFFTYLGKYLHPGPQKMIALTKKEQNWTFESGRRKRELKGIKNTFPGIAMDVLILLEGSSHPCLFPA